MRGKAGRAGRGLEEEKAGRGGGMRQGREGKGSGGEGNEVESRVGWRRGGK